MFEFRRLSPRDFALLGRWLAQPYVERWWNHAFTPAALERDFGPSMDGEEPNEDWVAMLDGRPIGLIQYCAYADYPDYRAELSPGVDVPDGAMSIDYLIGEPECVRRGIGRSMIVAFVDRIWATNPAATCVLVPVNSANLASWKALLEAGFRLVARMDLEPDHPMLDRMHEILRIDRPNPDR
ncbi:MAG: GNAT family N-acetyltransferase [Ilumatobacteraceae bacterium]